MLGYMNFTVNNFYQLNKYKYLVFSQLLDCQTELCDQSVVNIYHSFGLVLNKAFVSN